MADGQGRRSGQAPFYAVNRTLEEELAAQGAEVERLLAENQRLSATKGYLEHCVVVSQQDIQRLGAHINTTKTEADAQVRAMEEKIAKLEAEKSAAESIKEELHQAHTEAQGLLETNRKLSGQIQQALQETEIAKADIKRLPELQSTLERMKNEYQMLRKTFNQEKGQNVAKIEKIRVMEVDLARETEARNFMRTQVANAARRARGGIIVPSGVGNHTATGNSGGAAFPGSAGGAD
ncbi:protein FLX-like 4 [Daucus carota subsp. sativus]|uniref:protein FLX-like 4 n=1 Tax=Daucus carota subsp. sativus TaxID=79200 RepID=UPI0007F012A3|nr:PREDICTED: protein FLX-like 4 isoform X2 [Daucus carota subsp. sativus]XP_017255121.1 PREDICTED: protein FLX-like 4 isoform X2 [Daucus carota subsp. sativus]XP_017255122.1 PREDICTED: protein FLX-like 4 isoform X2 [Daucus carota subsp. sativus]XP_017255123.1 PREDICTED: protein FLX-like 4 isoform X2 [Daucus carota subsp. sativus]XP_017255124.1 PREDICTED: protein FLX-like 4 isoform X2 [Daucus carota subsp. sativus]XP_017255126.1 PREDICTED: protein FLX-like 4 isoform X2 [Daucus carota subsp. sa